MKKARFVATAAMIAAIYAAITIVQPFSSSAIQIRIAEALTVLAGLMTTAIPGLFVGCLIANIFVGAGLLDIVLGSLTTLTAAVISWLLRKNKWLVPLPPIVLNALVVGTYLHFLDGQVIPVWWNVAYIGAGQAVACYLIGMPLFYAIAKVIDRKKV